MARDWRKHDGVSRKFKDQPDVLRAAAAYLEG